MRIERAEIEAFIARLYEEASRSVRDHPFGGDTEGDNTKERVLPSTKRPEGSGDPSR